MAAALERTRQPASALHDLAAAAHARAAADGVVLTEEELALLNRPPQSNQDVIAIGALAARLNRRDIDERNQP
jgi:hypothetical protein